MFVLSLAYFTQPDVFKALAICSISQHFIAFYDEEILHCMRILHFVYPLIYRWALDCFDLLVVVNNAT